MKDGASHTRERGIRSRCNPTPHAASRPPTHLVVELVAVDALAAGAVAVGEVPALEHEAGDDTVELWVEGAHTHISPNAA